MHMEWACPGIGVVKSIRGCFSAREYELGSLASNNGKPSIAAIDCSITSFSRRASDVDSV